MAKKQITTCDRCGEMVWENDYEHSRFSVVIDRKTDAAGSMDDVWQDIDLCPVCLSIELQILLLGLSHNDRKTWLAGIHQYCKSGRSK